MEELNIKQLLKYIYQRKNILFYILLVSILIGVLYTLVIKKPIYEVTSKILIDKSDGSIEYFIISNDVLKNEKIRVIFDKSSKLITITAQTNNKEECFNITNEYMDNLKTRLEEMYNIKIFKILETPQFPKTTINIDYIRDIFMFVLIGIVIYILYIMIILNINGMVNNYEIENNAKINVLGKISLEKEKNKKQQISYNSKNINIINELKRIEANIELNKENQNIKTILLTGNKKRVGNTYITNNLAIQYSKLYKKVLIVDANMNSKKLTNLYNKKDKKGLTDIIKENKVEDIEKLVNKTEKENIFILPIGKENIGEELFLKKSIKVIIEELNRNYDIILIDTRVN